MGTVHSADRKPVAWRSSALASWWFWLFSRMLFWTLAAIRLASDQMSVDPRFERFPAWLFGAYARFDHGHFQRIALGGYFQLDRGNIAYDEAFFPGYPLAARGLAWVFGGGQVAEPFVTVAMSLISWAGAFAAGTIVVHLARSGRFFGIDWRIAALVFYLGPYGVFYMATYAEGPFVACAIGAWELARRRRWGWAAVMATVATVLRINGLFLLPALALVMLAGEWKRPQAWARLAWLGLPVVPPLLYFTWLWVSTGDFFFWFETQKHWGRTTTWPWECLRNSIELIGTQPEFRFQRTMEVLAVVLFIAALVQLVRWRAWDLVAFTALTLVSLTTSSYLMSVPRAMLSCFPVLVAMASWLTRAPWWGRAVGFAALWWVLWTNVSTILVNRWTG